MKKAIAIITIIFCLLITTTVFATDTQQAVDVLSQTGTLFDSKDNNKEDSNVISVEDKEDSSKNNEKNSETNNNTNNKQKTDNNNNNTISKENSTAVSKIAEMKDNEKKTLEDYKQAYGSDSYGFTAYVLSRIQVYSIPFCFLGIAISAIYQYVLGIRKMDTRDKGFAIMISIITLFVIAQVLPLIFAIVVKGWRG